MITQDTQKIAKIDPTPTFDPSVLFANLDIQESTRLEYQKRSKEYITFVNKNGFSVNSFLDFKRYLKSRTDWGVSTKNKKLTTARILLKELHRLGIVKIDITQNVKSFQHSKKHKKMGVTQQEVEQLSTFLNSQPLTPSTARVKAILSLLLLQGLRQIEVVRLNVKDIDLVGMTALVQGKGRDDTELIDLHPRTVEALTSYLKINHIADGALFTSWSNNSKRQRITTRGLRKIITDLFNQAGIQKNVHGCRHYFTTKLIESNQGDLLEVARYTRHKSLEMLQVYNDAIDSKTKLDIYYNSFTNELC